MRTRHTTKFDKKKNVILCATKVPSGDDKKRQNGNGERKCMIFNVIT